MGGHRDVLVPVLEEGRRLGFLGPGPVELHLDHAAGFVEVLVAAQGGGAGGILRGVDLGSGAGLPGLPLALWLVESEWVLVDAGARRTAFLRAAVQELGIEGRVSVAEERAEVLGRAPAFRAAFDVAVARSFGPPAVFAECAAPLLVAGGQAVVSEPPGGEPGRWPAEGLKQLGLVVGPAVRAGGAAYQVLEQRMLCPDRWPRRVGIPAKRPLF